MEPMTDEGAGTLPMIGTCRRVQISQTTVNTMMEMMPRRAVALHRLFLIDDMVSPSVTFPVRRP